MQGAMLSLPFRGSYPITQKFGERPEVYARFGLDGHNGVDFGLPIGTPVLASADGVIVASDFDRNGYGWHVRQKTSNGYLIIYAHLDWITVRKGERVQAGEQIGVSGNSGFSTGPHLHFEVRINERAVDPLPLLDFGSKANVIELRGLGKDYAYVTDSLNIRLGQNRSSEIRGTLRPGDVVRLSSEVEEQNDYVGVILYVHKNWLEIAS